MTIDLIKLQVTAEELRWIINGLSHTKLTHNEGAEADFRISMLHRGLREALEAHKASRPSV
jgi:hypothetical protein